jgi:hypothetical protein
MTPALEAPGTDSIEPINSNQQEDEQEEAPPPSNTEKQHSMEQRAFAVEKEIRFLNSMNKRKYYPVPKS